MGTVERSHQFPSLSPNTFVVLDGSLLLAAMAAERPHSWLLALPGAIRRLEKLSRYFLRFWLAPTNLVRE